MSPGEKILKLKRLVRKETPNRMINLVRRIAKEHELNISEEKILRVASKLYDEWYQAVTEKIYAVVCEDLQSK